MTELQKVCEIMENWYFLREGDKCMYCKQPVRMEDLPDELDESDWDEPSYNKIAECDNKDCSGHKIRQEAMDVYFKYYPEQRD